MKDVENRMDSNDMYVKDLMIHRDQLAVRCSAKFPDTI